jgi:fluoride ion exporter CrcB/FEX
MPSINDLIFILWLVICYGLILLSPGKLQRQRYSQLMAVIFITSCFVIIWFHETVIDVSQSSPMHAAILVLAQFGTLTLTSKIWFSVNYKTLSKRSQTMLKVILFGALSTFIIFSYWLYKISPEMQLLLYPFASLAISLAAEMIEEKWE